MFCFPHLLSRYFCLALGIVLLAGRTSYADTVRLIDRESVALSLRLEQIANAQRSIDAAYYSVHSDGAAARVLAAMRAAARRGVRVRLIVDCYFNSIPRGVQRHLIDEGVEIRSYNRPELLKSQSFLCRLHDKMMVVDGVSLIVGGRNIGNPYFGRGGDSNFIDRDLLVIGPVAQHAAAYFQILWNSDYVRPVHSWLPVPNLVPGSPVPSLRDAFTNPAQYRAESAKAFLDSVACSRQPLMCQEPPMACEWPPVEVNSEDVWFLHSGRPSDWKCPDISDQLEALMCGAQSRIVIETPYLVLWERFERVLQHVRARGVAVCILTNSIDTTDNLFVNAQLTNQKKRFRELGVDLFEYRGAGTLHAKSMIIDHIVVTGSYNMNPRSDYYDTETVVVIRSEELAEQTLQSIGSRLALSCRAAIPDGLVQHIFPPEPAAPHKYLTVQFLRLLMPGVQRHL